MLKGSLADSPSLPACRHASVLVFHCSVLLKESFVDSFPPRDRPFMRQFAESQMFAVYTDAVLG